ncbi:MAG: hypothetical protein ACYTGC_16645, partial [Planctomycetota bacterium]
MRLVVGVGLSLALAAARPAGASERLHAESTAYRDARETLPSSFVEHETSRYVVLADTDRSWAVAQAELLERAHHEFRRFCRTLRLDAAPLRHKLVAVIFEDRDAYQRFALRHDRVPDAALSGYYAPANDRVVFYHVESNPSVAEARRQLLAMRTEIDEMSIRLGDARRRGAHDDARVLRSRQAEFHRHWNQEQKRVDDFSVQASTATTVHE